MSFSIRAAVDSDIASRMAFLILLSMYVSCRSIYASLWPLNSDRKSTIALDRSKAPNPIANSDRTWRAFLSLTTTGVGITIVGGKFVRIEIRKGIVGFGVAFLKEERSWMRSISQRS
ncbi:MAG: hypothetical protein JWN70_4255, partial [Planctomycetaceae bacterium]|nr:hypothetical protein [Planctomycetaceae bacterium]